MATLCKKFTDRSRPLHYFSNPDAEKPWAYNEIGDMNGVRAATVTVVSNIGERGVLTPRLLLHRGVLTLRLLLHRGVNTPRSPISETTG